MSSRLNRANLDRELARRGWTAEDLAIPPPAPVDERRLAQLAHQYGIEIVGPPPD